jgi:hypothetical protein
MITGTGQRASFQCRSAQGLLRYEVRPRTGSFDDVRATFEHKGKSVALSPLAGGGLVFETKLGPTPARAENVKLLSSRLSDGVLTTNWAFSAGGLQAQYTIRYRLKGATLMVDVASAGEIYTAGLMLAGRGQTGVSPGAGSACRHPRSATWTLRARAGGQVLGPRRPRVRVRGDRRRGRTPALGARAG